MERALPPQARDVVALNQVVRDARVGRALLRQQPPAQEVQITLVKATTASLGELDQGID